MSIKPRGGRGGGKEALAKDLLHMFRDELSTSQNRKYHPLKLDVGRAEELCESVPLSGMEKSFLKQISGDFWENWLTP